MCATSATRTFSTLSATGLPWSGASEKSSCPAIRAPLSVTVAPASTCCAEKRPLIVAPSNSSDARSNPSMASPPLTILSHDTRPSTLTFGASTAPETSVSSRTNELATDMLLARIEPLIVDPTIRTAPNLLRVRLRSPLASHDSSASSPSNDTSANSSVPSMQKCRRRMAPNPFGSSRTSPSALPGCGSCHLRTASRRPGLRRSICRQHPRAECRPDPNHWTA
jgi:hypothetical protein